MSFTVSPSTVAPSGSLTANGTGAKKRPTRIRVSATDPTMPNAILAEFTMPANSKFTKAINAPGGPNRATTLVLQQQRADGVWAQTADVKLLIAQPGNGGGTTPLPPIPPPPDTAAPIIGNVSSSVTTTTATITWTTDEPTTGIVEYGPTTGYGSSTPATSQGTSHSRTITGLTPGATSHCRITATDVVSNSATTADFTFTTTATATVPGAPTGLTATSGDTVAYLSWTAPSNGGSPITGYKYNVNGGSFVATGSTATNFTVTGLTNGVSYSFTVKATNAVGDSTASGSASATPAVPADTTAPTVSNVVISNVTTTGATITCNTNEAATVVVAYGPGYGSQTSPTSSGTSHSRTLTSLTPSTTYHFQIRATDTAGNIRLDQDRSFTTSAAGITPSAPIVVPAGSSNVLIENKSFSGGTTGTAILLNGTSGSHINTVTIRNCTAVGFDTIIRANYVDNLVIEDCPGLTDATYTGIMIHGGSNGRVSRNLIQRIGPQRNYDPANENNAYGIAFESNSLSTDWLVDDNVIEDVPTWMGINAHQGVRLTIDGNITRRCRRAFFFVGNTIDTLIVQNNDAQAVTSGHGDYDPTAYFVGDTTNSSVINNHLSTTYPVAADGGEWLNYVRDYLQHSTGLTRSGNVRS